MDLLHINFYEFKSFLRSFNLMIQNQVLCKNIFQDKLRKEIHGNVILQYLLITTFDSDSFPHIVH